MLLFEFGIAGRLFSMLGISFIKSVSLLILTPNPLSHIPYLATRILINTNKSRLAGVLPHKGFRNHNLLINKSTPLYAAQKH